MWLVVGDRASLLNLDHTRELKAEGNSLRAVLTDGRVVLLQDFATPEDAKGALNQIREALGSDVCQV
jgi:hypothetical protein